jgi:alanine racemase
MVRLGIGLYGISSSEEHRHILKPVIQLKTLVSQVKHLKKGESIGYNRNFIADHEMKTATIPIGYADGFPRSLGNGNWHCKVNDKLIPVIGNVCMDMCFLDVTDVAGIREKDEVIVIGPSNNIYEMARRRGTIPYEVLTGFPERIKRIFYYGD